MQITYTDMLSVKNYLSKILNLRQIFQYLLKILLKITMSKVIQFMYWLLMSYTQLIFTKNIDIYHFYPIEVKLTKLISYFVD